MFTYEKNSPKLRFDLEHVVDLDLNINIQTSKYNEDLLFWMFYSNPNDRMQMLAAEELFQRNWKFHKEEKIWISRTRNIEVNTPF